MPCCHINILRNFFVTLSCTVTFSSVALAQNTDDKEATLYQIEMIVFERDSEFTGEKWPKNVRLYYPTKLDFLIDKASITEANVIEENTELPDKESEDTTPTVEVPPFTKLDHNGKTLTKEANALSRRRGFRVLFHEAWRQTLIKTDDANSIVILGGDQFDDHYELEGSVLFGVNRYLHIHTNLWFNRFEAKPLDRLSQLQFGNISDSTSMIDDTLSLNSAPQTSDRFNALANTSFTQRLPEIPLGFPESADTKSPALAIENPDGTPSFGDSASIHNNTLLTSNIEDAVSANSDAYFTDPFTQGLGNTYFDSSRDRDRTYRAIQVIELKQKRRMRSQQLHYIDHPRLGILVKIIPHERANDTNESPSN